jgi:hypothetical protein
MTPIHLIAEIYCLPIPEGTEEYHLKDKEGMMPALMCRIGPVSWMPLPLPPGSWQIICTTKECQKKVPMGIVECKIVEYDGGIKGTRFVNYMNPDQRFWFINKTESFRSLLLSKKMDPNKNYLIIKKAR